MVRPSITRPGIVLANFGVRPDLTFHAFGVKSPQSINGDRYTLSAGIENPGMVSKPLLVRAAGAEITLDRA